MCVCAWVCDCAVVVDYGTSEYGYIEGEVSSDEEVLVIVRRSKTDPHKPQHDIKLFPTKLEDDTSRVYLYNAVWNTNSELGGLQNIMHITLATIATLYIQGL